MAELAARAAAEALAEAVAAALAAAVSVQDNAIVKNKHPERTRSGCNFMMNY
jgi:hypothetical protein